MWIGGHDGVLAMLRRLCRDAFEIAQRHYVNPVSVTEGGVCLKDGEPQISLYVPGEVSITDRKP